jgi:hypothetical protein
LGDDDDDRLKNKKNLFINLNLLRSELRIPKLIMKKFINSELL